MAEAKWSGWYSVLKRRRVSLTVLRDKRGGVEPVRVSSLWRCSPVEAHPAISREASSVSVIERKLIASYIAYSKIVRIWMLEASPMMLIGELMPTIP